MLCQTPTWNESIKTKSACRIEHILYFSVDEMNLSSKDSVTFITIGTFLKRDIGSEKQLCSAPPAHRWP